MCSRSPDRIARALLLATALLLGCERERRDPRSGTAAASAFLGNAYHMAEGKTLYTLYICVGCHAQGGGAIGPPLMDARWIYGSAPEQIRESIVQGRPNGMPSFREEIPELHVQRLVAYVRSLPGLVRKDVAPGRGDHMSAKRPENILDPQPPLAEPGRQP